jgi:MraZ protein
MADQRDLILGEYARTLDDRFRISLPPELLHLLVHGRAESGQVDSDPVAEPSGAFDAILAKERPGALSLWNAAVWKEKLDAGVSLVESKMRAGRLEGRWDEVQTLGRLLSTRQRPVQLAGRGRLVIPDSFREFLGVQPGSEALLIGAGVCVEIWRPDAWLNYVAAQMPEFRQIFDRLSG